MAQEVTNALNNLSNQELQALKSHAEAVDNHDNEQSKGVLQTFAQRSKIAAIVSGAGGIIWLAKFIRRH